MFKEIKMDKEKYINKLCRINFEHILLDGSKIVRNEQIYISTKNSDILDDKGDVVIDPVAGSGSTLKACQELNRSCYGFEIDKTFYEKAKDWLGIEPLKTNKHEMKQLSIFDVC